MRQNYCKVWARPSDDIQTTEAERVIALHGWQDNYGSFDALLPLITDRAVIVAIHFPGYGVSNHFPLEFAYTHGAGRT
jgi:pimeloyl-ACP methyl ester carboxylesterase